MRTLVIVNATCDLPGPFVRHHQLRVLPVKLVLGDHIFTDSRDGNLTLFFHQRYASSRQPDVEVEVCSADAIAALFLEQWVAEYDRAILLSTAKSANSLFENATDASFAVLRAYRDKRRQAGINTPFYLNVLDSRTLFSGEAVLAWETVRLLQDPNLPFNELRRRIEGFRQHIHCYLLPDDLGYAPDRILEKERPSAGFLEFHLGNMLDIKQAGHVFDGKIGIAFKRRSFDQAFAHLLELAKQAINQGLKSPLVVVSYAGDPQVIKQKRAFGEFEQHARQWGVEVMLSMMSATGGVKIGPGAVSLAYAA
jgi:fatty acid-binding protein DegV